MNEPNVAVIDSEEMELLSGPHLLDIHTIAELLENPLCKIPADM